MMEAMLDMLADEPRKGCNVVVTVSDSVAATCIDDRPR
jgi:hypothetical protein